jgi:transcriptional regulator with XRE-family HTH domain
LSEYKDYAIINIIRAERRILMLFYQKLDLLMKVQNVTNSSLARALSVDPSLVSRWRTGDRKPNQKNNYIKNISIYFSSHAKMDYQKAALYEIMGLDINKNHKNLYSLSELLYSWLTDKKSPDKVFVENFFNSLSKKRQNDPKADINKSESLTLKHKEKDFEILNGIEGKRKGVVKFLKAVAASEKQITLLLYSNEDMDWLSGDKEFLNKWSMLLKIIIQKGHKIKIIHTIKREMSEMLAAIDYWMPFYLTGAIEPYYYPKYQENIFRRTIFVAPGTAALNCSTVSEYSDKAQQFLYWSPEKINHLAEEFNTFLKRCRPLMRIYTGKNTYNFNQLQIEFEEQQGKMISISDIPSFNTMPEKLIKRFLEKNEVDKKIKKAILSIYKQRRTGFNSNISDNHYYEIISLPTKEDFYKKENSLKINDFFSELNLNYSIHDFCEHLENNIKLLEKHSNYHLLIAEDFPYNNLKLAIKDEVGAIVNSNNEKPVIIAFNQPNITNSFYTYLKYIIREIPEREKNKTNLIKKLNNYLDNLKD